MTIEEMKAKGFKHYTAIIEKKLVTKEVEVWAKNRYDAETILANASEELSDCDFEEWVESEIHDLTESICSPIGIAAAQSTVTDCNEDFYNSEEQ